jgi:8-oxo-dGTP pyrophosphatase MutT (NUDIX family)
MQVHGPWVIEERTRKYTSAFLDLDEDSVTRPDGTPGAYATVTLKAGVAVLPLDADGDVHLTRQFRYALGRDSVETPSGAFEAGEAPLVAAARELREELGFHADEFISLGAVDVDTSIVRCPVHLFVARRLQFVGMDQDPSELIRPVKVPLDVAVEMVMNSQITHAPSCVLILKGSRHRSWAQSISGVCGLDAMTNRGPLRAYRASLFDRWFDLAP